MEDLREKMAKIIKQHQLPSEDEVFWLELIRQAELASLPLMAREIGAMSAETIKFYTDHFRKLQAAFLASDEDLFEKTLKEWREYVEPRIRKAAEEKNRLLWLKAVEQGLAKVKDPALREAVLKIVNNIV